MTDSEHLRIADDVRLGRGVQMHAFVNLYGCTIGDDTSIGAFVEIQKGATVGRCCKISSHSFVCEGVTIEDECFIGHGVMFTNDRHPRATDDAGRLQSATDWALIPTRVKRRFQFDHCVGAASEAVQQDNTIGEHFWRAYEKGKESNSNTSSNSMHSWMRPWDETMRDVE